MFSYIDDDYLTIGGVFDLSSTPTKTGYTFVGWFYTADMDTPANPLYHIIENTSITAKWTVINYTVTYTLNGGDNHQDNPATFDVTDLPIALEDPGKLGYDFDGWYGNAEFTGDPITSIASVGNKALFAKWSVAEYTITYNLDGGTNHLDNPATFDLNDLPITLGVATKADHDFDGWYGNAEFTGDPITTIEAVGDKTFYAKFTAQ